jgi:hypothetical protein
LTHSPEDGAVPDPYYGGMDGFQNVFDVLKRSSEALLDELEKLIESKNRKRPFVRQYGSWIYFQV